MPWPTPTPQQVLTKRTQEQDRGTRHCRATLRMLMREAGEDLLLLAQEYEQQDSSPTARQAESIIQRLQTLQQWMESSREHIERSRQLREIGSAMFGYAWVTNLTPALPEARHGHTR